jgi:outer membrane protein assembly factor BamA
VFAASLRGSFLSVLAALLVVGIGALWPTTAGAEPTAPRVQAVRWDGPEGPNRSRLSAIASDLVHRPYDADETADVVRRLEAIPGLGGVQVERLGDAATPDQVELLFRFDGRPRRLARLDFAWDDAPVEEARSWEFYRRIESSTDGFRLVTGEPYHPFLRDLDLDTVRTYYVARGFRDVRLNAAISGEDKPAENTGGAGLLDLTIRIETGLQYVAEKVTLSGGTFDQGASDSLVSGLRTQSEEPLSLTDLAADRARIALAQCRLGHPMAQVTLREGPGTDTTEGERRVPIEFNVVAGPFVRTGRVQVVGRYVPWGLVRRLPLQEGDPFCPRLIEDARDNVRGFLRDRGFPDPVVSVATRRRLNPGGGRTTAVTFVIESIGDVRVERIWLRGNRVTREDIVRQHFAVAEGQLYQQSAVDTSIQALRRSGLFKGVDVRILPGTRSGQVHLVFDLVEQGPVGVNVGRQQLILRNVDVTNWPGDYEQFEQARAFRGGGQVVDVFAQPDRKGVEWRNEYFNRFLVAELNLNRRLGDTKAFEETWYTIGFGLGPKAFEGRVAAVPFVELEWTRSEQMKGEDVPVLDGDAVTLAGGLKLRLDLNRRDEERIPYLGFDGDVQGRGGTAIMGESFKFTDYKAQARLHLPLWLTRRGQHFVLRLRANVREVFADESGKLQAHQRFFPQARGYGAHAMAVAFPLADNQTLKIGGLHAAEAGAEIRLPMPWGRRNAFSPFVDAGTVGDETSALFRDPRLAFGLSYAFSLFRERVEGVVWGAYAAHADALPTYAGANLGGNF